MDKKTNHSLPEFIPDAIKFLFIFLYDFFSRQSINQKNNNDKFKIYAEKRLIDIEKKIVEDEQSIENRIVIKQNIQMFAFLPLVVSGFCLTFTTINYFTLQKIELFSLSFGILFLILTFIFKLIPIFIDTYFLDQKIDLNRIERDLLKAEINNEDKNLIFLKRQELQLHNYYRQSLSQSKNIFVFGIILAILGFSGIPFIIWADNMDWIKNQSQPWILAIVQAVLVSFVLGIFLKMYEKTTDSVNQFYQGLLDAYKEHSK